MLRGSPRTGGFACRLAERRLAFCPNSLQRRTMACGGTPSPGRALRLSGQRPVRSSAVSFFLQCSRNGSRASPRRLALRAALSLPIVAAGLCFGFRRYLPFARCPQLDASTSRLREADCDRLLGRTRSMFSFANVVHLLPHEFACLRAGRFSLPRIFLRPLDGFFFRHVPLPPN